MVNDWLAMGLAGSVVIVRSALEASLAGARVWRGCPKETTTVNTPTNPMAIRSTPRKDLESEFWFTKLVLRGWKWVSSEGITFESEAYQ